MKNRLRELYSELNHSSSSFKDPTYTIESKQIDIVAIVEMILNYVDGCKLINFNEIIKTDYRGFLFDISLQEYFGEETNNYDKANRTILNPR